MCIRDRGVGVALDGAGAGRTAEAPHADPAPDDLLVGQQARGLIHQRERSAPNDDIAFLGKVHRDDGNLLCVEVEPDVELRPVRKREDADALALPQARVVEAPQLRALVLRIPLPGRVAEAVDPLLRCV